ncbi:MAG: thymidine phosphorylase [Rhodanobacteraceae bacterium]|nr:thymidine phosphorylase [Rhodanobacteraceae bacterium]MBK7042567.1 thymidine phosphorylase [Rhodanobacteraceae bacterium]MBP9153432.1 thymidine phosphorylase [Xanthomonadales bacterium]
MAYTPQSVIADVRDARAPDPAALNEFVRGMADGRTSEGQMAAFAMAVRCRGLSASDTVRLTLAMRDSGERLTRALLDIDRPLLDKHSTGGVGDAVSLALAPMLAACGAAVPMLSGRGLGHTGGTLDKLTAIPGYTVDADIGLMRAALRSAGCAIVSAGKALAPADRRLYAVRDVTATVDAMPLIVASILSKKLSVQLDALVLDVKCGSGAFFPARDDAECLARSLVAVANDAGLACSALVTDMGEPLVPAVGNATELRAVLDYLRGDPSSPRMHAVCLALAGEVLRRGGLATTAHDATTRLQHALDSGAAAEHFERMVAALGGPSDLMLKSDRYLPTAPIHVDVIADDAGTIRAIDSRCLGDLVVDLGGGRRHPDDCIDLAVGLDQVRSVGDLVARGEPLLRLCLRSADQIEWARTRVLAAFELGAAVAPVSLIHARIDVEHC